MKSTFPTSGLFTHQVKRLLGTIASPFRVTCEKPKIDGVARAPYRAVT